MRSLVRYWLVFALLGGGLLAPHPLPADAGGPDGVVGDGTPESCTYAELNFELGAPGYITFACGANPLSLIHISEVGRRQ